MIPMHYEENGVLQDIDMTIQNGVINSGLYKVSLLTNKIGFEAIDRSSGKKITVSLGKIGNQSIPYASPTIEGNKVSWASVKPGVDVEFIFNPHQVNIFRILQNATAEKVAEWDIDEELGEKIIKMNDKVRGRDAAKNETKHTVVIAPPETNPNRKTYTIRDTFDGKVLKRNLQTRVKEESNDVSYPVRIDPTITITISSGADDGYARIQGTATTFFYQSQTFLYVFNPSSLNEARGWIRFPGITIPQSSTINTAQLKIFKNSGTTGQVDRFEARKVNNPAAPTNFTQVFSPATLATNFVNKTITTVTGNIGTINVQTIAQELVNTFDYSNEAMLFFVKQTTLSATDFLGIEPFEAVGTNPAQLVIDYTAGGGGSLIKTWNGLADTSTKTWNGLARASIKNFNGLA